MMYSDIDVLSYYLSGLKPSKVQSLGSVGHFKPSKKPKEAGDAKRCQDCAYAKDCVWEAKKIYVDPLSQVEDSQRVSHFPFRAHFPVTRFPILPTSTHSVAPPKISILFWPGTVLTNPVVGPTYPRRRRARYRKCDGSTQNLAIWSMRLRMRKRRGRPSSC